MTLFSDFIENSMEVFMDDFCVFGKSFHKYLHNLEQVLERCEESNLILNWDFEFLLVLDKHLKLLSLQMSLASQVKSMVEAVLSNTTM